MSVTNETLDEQSSAADRIEGPGDHSPGRGALSSRETKTKADLLDQARNEASERKQRKLQNEFIGKGSTASPTKQASSPMLAKREATNPKHINAVDMDPDSDEALFIRYQSGDQRAFMRIYERYKSAVYGYCARAILSVGLDSTHVEDAFQEVFLRVAQYQHTFTGGEFKAWIFTVTRHQCLSTKKKSMQHRVSMENVGDAENLDEHVSSEARAALSMEDDPLERMSKNEQTDLLLKAIAELPESYREALIMSDYEGLTYDEIGKITGTSLSTIRIRIFRAKARLRKALLPIIGDDVVGLDTTKGTGF
jgi:RNA polymerase sigma-70 factor, ECF subfamily